MNSKRGDQFHRCFISSIINYGHCVLCLYVVCRSFIIIISHSRLSVHCWDRLGATFHYFYFYTLLSLCCAIGVWLFSPNRSDCVWLLMTSTQDYNYFFLKANTKNLNGRNYLSPPCVHIMLNIVI